MDIDQDERGGEGAEADKGRHELCATFGRFMEQLRNAFRRLNYLGHTIFPPVLGRRGLQSRRIDRSDRSRFWGRQERSVFPMKQQDTMKKLCELYFEEISSSL